MAISPVFGTITSGLAFESQRIAVSANNVANVLTNGFQPSEVVGQATPGGGVQGVVERAPMTPMPSFPSVDGSLLPGSGTDLIKESVTQITAQAAYKAQIAMFKVADENVQTVLNLRS